MEKKIYLNRNEAPEERLQTDYIQQALDSCRVSGGEVILGDGSWLIGSLRLYSDTTLRLRSGTHLIASSRYEDYKDWGFESTLGYLKSPYIVDLWHLPQDYVKSPITAVDAHNVAVIGELGATIDGQDCRNENGEEGFRGPMGMVFCRCSHVTLKGYTYVRCGNWAHQLDSCEDIFMDHVRVLGGHDGINIHHCKSVQIQNCDFRTGDDCIAGYDAENVLVKNCSLNTSCNSFRIGARNLQVESCRFWGPGEYPHRASGRHNTLFAFNYYAFDYDTCRPSSNWIVRDCTFDQIDSFMHYNYGGCWDHNASPLSDLTVDNCSITNLLSGSRIRSTVPMSVKFRHVKVSFRDGLPKDGLCDTTSQVRFHIRDLKVDGL